MTGRIKAALIGVGSISQRGILPHMMQVDTKDVVDLIAVCDVDETRVRKVAEKYNIKLSFTRYEDVLDISGLDAVLLATPIGSHFKQAKKAIKLGKHVYLQKTMATTLSEADDLIRSARKANVKIVASPGQMLSPVARQIRAEIKGGVIGKVYWAFANTAFMGHEFESFRDENPINPTWYYKKPGGGPIYDMSVYVLHTITGILGPAKRVLSMSGIGLPVRTWKDVKTTVDMDDNTLLMLDFGENCFAVVGGQFCQAGRVVGWGFTGFYGSKGSLEITGYIPNTTYPSQIETNPAHLKDSFGSLDQSDQIENIPYSFSAHSAIPEAHVWMDIRHFFDCILNDKKPIPGPEHARHVIEIIEKGYEAARLGKAQSLHTSF